MLENANLYLHDSQVNPYSRGYTGYSTYGGDYLKPDDYYASQGFDSIPQEQQTNEFSSYTSAVKPSKPFPRLENPMLYKHTSLCAKGLTSSGSYASDSGSYHTSSSAVGHFDLAQDQI